MTVAGAGAEGAGKLCSDVLLPASPAVL